MGAVLSEDGLYRYRLNRFLDPRTMSTVLFIMLNPSTADAENDDPTIRRCIGFAKRLGMGSLEVNNLYAFRATDPKDLFKAKEPIGPDNHRHISDCVLEADIIIAAWGTHGKDAKVTSAVRDIVAKFEKKMFCLGKTKEGHPKHPLYLKSDQELIPF